MSNAELDPHVLISARMADNLKIISLPTDRARWGWVIVLGEAKLQRPAGRFPTLAVLRHVAGKYASQVDHFINAGLLETVPILCDRCVVEVLDPKDGNVVVHDWRAHQERRSRSQEWRDANGVPSGHVNLPGNGGETAGKQSGTSHAGAPDRADAGALQSPSPQSPSEEPTSEDLVLTWLAGHGATIQPNGNGYHRELVTFVGRRGAQAVIRAMEARYAAGDRSVAQLLYGAMNDAEPIHRPRGGKPEPKGHQRSEEELADAFRTA